MIRKILSLVLIIFLVFSGCGLAVPENTHLPTVPETSAPPTQSPTETPTVAPTAPPHSALYIPGVNADDVVLYFNEVCLSAEFINSGDPSFLQRWEEPICYALHGAYTPEDIEKIENFAAWLNTVEGFPGIFEAEEVWQSNLDIHFCDQDELIDRMGDNFYGTDGAVTFWYDNDIIYNAIICIRTDLDQQLRNSVILEELYNGLGPIQDTSLRPASIIYAEFSQPQELTAMDQLILKLLYHPQLRPGMTSQECETIIRSLYY